MAFAKIQRNFVFKIKRKGEYNLLPFFLPFVEQYCKIYKLIFISFTGLKNKKKRNIVNLFIKSFVNQNHILYLLFNRKLNKTLLMKRKITLLLGLVGVMALSTLFSGCNKYTMKDAESMRERKQYYMAAEIYSKVAASGKETKEIKDEALLKSAECYRKANDFKKAKRAYEKILRKDPKNSDALYYMGLITMWEAAEQTNLDAYKNARKYFTKYLDEVPGDESVKRKVESCDSAESWMTQESRFVVNNFREANTKWCDFSPMIADKKDNLIYFASDRELGINKKKMYGGSGNFYVDIWSIEKEKAKRGVEKWGTPALIPGQVNNKFNDGVHDFDRRYSTIYFTRCNGVDGKQLYCKIYEAKKIGNEWVDVTVLPFCENDSANFAHPTLSTDGSKLFFSSDMQGGEGGYDLYVVNFVKRGKTWSDPINLGKTINTDKDEVFPYYSFHDDHLYFSSNGHVGLGGLDILKSQGSGTEWTQPENLKYPLNSGGDDFGITFTNSDPNKGYFTSNRQGGRGCDDIYEFKINPLVFKLVGTVTDCKTGLPLPNALVEITNDKDTSKISFRTDLDGNYDTLVLKEFTTYEIKVTNREAYYFDGEPRTISTVGLKKSKLFIEDFCLNPQLDFKRVLPIFYRLDKADIDPPAAAVLADSLLPLLLQYPKIRIELGSHTDCRSSYAYNISLSQRRADSAVAFLVSKGVDKRRIVAKGYGESQLINDCACEGAQVEGKTKYELGTDSKTGTMLFARKQDIVNNSYVYVDYRPSEISVVNNIKYVSCDEFQHRQNRRTTIKILDVNFDPNMKMEDSNDPNNSNGQMVIVKLEKEGNVFKGSASANKIEPLGPSIFVNTDKIEISPIELKNLIDKKAIQPTDIKGATLQQITSGKIPAGATLTVKEFRIGGADQGKVYNDIVLDIVPFPSSFRIGIKALESKYGATFNSEEGELALTAINAEALKGGPVNSTLTEEPTKAPEKNLDQKENVIKLKIIEESGKKFIAVMVNGSEFVNFAYDLNGRNTWMDEATVEQLFNNKVITKKDFGDGEKVKLPGGTKVPSNSFTIEKMELGSEIINNTKFKFSSKAELPELGRNFFKNFVDFEEKDGYLYLLPKPSRAARQK